MAFFGFALPTLVTFGEEAINELGRIAAKYGSRVLIVMNGQTLAETGHIDKAVKSLKNFNIDYNIYDEINPESDSSDADMIANIANFGKADAIVALGGFKTQNIAKAAATAVMNGGESSDFLKSPNVDDADVHAQHLNQQKIYNAPMPLIAIPTMVGTLSEVSSGYYLRDKYDGRIKEALSKQIYASDAIIDPTLHLTIPNKYLVTSAINVFASAFEVFISKHMNAISDSLALRAIELVHQNLQNLVEDQANIKYRTNLAMASLLCSVAVNSSMPGALRAISLGANSVNYTYPGIVVTILLPHIMDYNVTEASKKYIQILKAFGEDTTEMTRIEAGIKTAETMRFYLSSFSLPMRLSEIDVHRTMFDTIAKEAENFVEIGYSPRSISREELVALLEQAH